MTEVVRRKFEEELLYAKLLSAKGIAERVTKFRIEKNNG